jgi:hypothetical protein
VPVAPTGMTKHTITKSIAGLLLGAVALVGATGSASAMELSDTHDEPTSARVNIRWERLRVP